MKRKKSKQKIVHKADKSAIFPTSIIVFCIIVIVYFCIKLIHLPAFFKNKDKMPQIKNEESATAGWKTYTNADFGFSFKHPPEMDVAEYFFEVAEDSNDKAGIRIVMRDASDELRVVTDVNDGWGTNPCIYQTEKRIGIYQTQVVTFKQENGSGGCEDKYIDFVALINYASTGHPFPIELELTKIDKQNYYSDSVMFDQILASFKFSG